MRLDALLGCESKPSKNKPGPLRPMPTFLSLKATPGQIKPGAHQSIAPRANACIQGQCCEDLSEVCSASMNFWWLWLHLDLLCARRQLQTSLQRADLVRDLVRGWSRTRRRMPIPAGGYTAWQAISSFQASRRNYAFKHAGRPVRRVLEADGSLGKEVLLGAGVFP
jgi:hypothetical protein